jgi:hypothetical protein
MGPPTLESPEQDGRIQAAPPGGHATHPHGLTTRAWTDLPRMREGQWPGGGSMQMMEKSNKQK